MIRRRQVLPDENGIVTRDALLEAMVSCADFLDFAGGALSVVTQRAPTNLDGEMVTVGAVIEWRHSTGVKPGPAQFEQPTEKPYENVKVAGESIPEPEESFPDAIAREIDLQSDPDNPDGFDYDKLEEEDVDVPASTR